MSDRLLVSALEEHARTGGGRDEALVRDILRRTTESPAQADMPVLQQRDPFPWGLAVAAVILVATVIAIVQFPERWTAPAPDTDRHRSIHITLGEDTSGLWPTNQRERQPNARDRGPLPEWMHDEPVPGQSAETMGLPIAAVPNPEGEPLGLELPDRPSVAASLPQPSDNPPSRGPHRSTLQVNDWQSPWSRPLSSFALATGDRGYTDLIALLQGDREADSMELRVEELLQHFRYPSYAEPPSEKHEPVSFALELADCPWEESHLLLRVGLQANGDPASEDPSVPVVTEARIAVEFDPVRVAAYRLIGYANEAEDVAADPEAIAAEAAGGGVPTADLVAGQQVTALYEIVPRELPRGRDATEESTRLIHRLTSGTVAASATMLTPQDLCAVSLLCVPSDPSAPSFLTARLGGQPVSWREASDDFQFAASLALVGLILEESEHRGSGDLDLAYLLANRARSAPDPKGERRIYREALQGYRDRLDP